MSKIINLNSPTLSVLEIVNNTPVQDILVFMEDLNGGITFLSSCKDLPLLLLAKQEIEKEISSLLNQHYPDEADSE